MIQNGLYSDRSVLLVGHRGFPTKAPENTLASFRIAAEVPVDMVELDVHLSKDEQLIVIHDATLDRTTNGSGSVAEYTVQELKQFDAGSWFGEAFKAEPIPTLGEVVAALPETMLINIEIKPEAVRDGNNGIQKRVGEFITELHLEHRIVVSSFHHGVLKLLKESFPEIHTGVLYAFPRDFGKKPSELAKRVGAEIFICNRREVTQRVVDNAHENELRVAVYTLDTPRQIARALNLGIDAVVSNAPDVAKQVMRSRNLR